MTNAKRAKASAVAGLVLLTLVLYWPGYNPSAKVSFLGYEVFAVAKSLVKYHSFSDPFLALPTGPTAHVPPAYPAYLAAVLAIFGQGAVAIAVLKWAALLMFAAQLAGLPFLTSRLHLGFWSGVLAGVAWLAAGIPPVIVSDATLAGLLVMIASYLMVMRLESEFSRGQLFLWSVVWAALLLTQPAAVLVLVAGVAVLHFASIKSMRPSLALVLLPMLLVAPWIARNFLVFHKLFFVRDNLGLEMAVSNRSCAGPLFDENESDGCFAEAHPNENLAAAAQVRELGEIEFNHLRMEEAITWIKTNPGPFVELSAERFAMFWFPPDGERFNSGIVSRPWVLSCFTALSIPGMVLMWRNARASSYVVGLWVLFFPPIYYLTQFMMRYRYPILWATFVPGSYSLIRLAWRIAPKPSDKSGGKKRTRRGARKSRGAVVASR